MITRGHLIGNIVDELSSLANQITTRSKLGLYDLNVFSEIFFRDVLNALYGWKLEGLNINRSNEPGLDLGDKVNKVAVQVTSRSDAAKVNYTLGKITADQANDFKKIYVFMAGEKREKYKLDETLSKKYSFTAKNILDVKDICRQTMDLPIEGLVVLHELIRANVMKMSIELEVRDPETGKFPTSGFDKWEEKSEPKVGDGKEFAKWFMAEHEVPMTFYEIKALEKDLVEIAQRLRRLPRVTREFLTMLFERRSPIPTKRFSEYWCAVRYATVEREYNGRPDALMAELGLLIDEKFVEVNGEDSHEFGAPEIGMRIPANSDELAFSFLDYTAAKNLDLRKVIGLVDFSEF